MSLAAVALLDECHAGLVRLAARYVGPDEAEDAVQEAALVLLAMERAPTLALLRCVVRTQAIKLWHRRCSYGGPHGRSFRRDEVYLVTIDGKRAEPDGATSTRTPQTPCLEATVLDRLALLEAAQTEPVLLYQAAGWSWTETAARLGITRRQAEQRAWRWRRDRRAEAA